MKNLFLIIFCLMCINLKAQNNTLKKNDFIRIYNVDNLKIGQGKIVEYTDSTISLLVKNNITNYHFQNIGTIKSKRSGGNNIIRGGLVGGGIVGLITAGTADPDDFLGFNPAQGAVIGFIIGFIPGALIGTATIPFKNSDTYTINADPVLWNKFIKLLAPNTQFN